MDYIQTPFLDFKISRIVYGSWAIGGWYWGKTDDRESIKSIHAALDSGIQTFDTAPIYGMGHSEEVLGTALEGKPDAVIATKCGLRYDSPEHGVFFFEMDEYNPSVQVFRNLHAESILHECELSLKRLKRDRIDIYQIHWPDRSSNEENTASALNRLYDEGKIRSVGVCNYSVELLIRLKKYLRVPLVFDQEKLSLIHRKALDGNIPYVKKNKMIFLAYGSLAQGLLSNKVDAERKFQENDYRNKSEIMQQHYRISVSSAFSKLEELREKYNASYANLASAWAMHAAGDHSCVIIGIRNENQALENSRACNIHLNGNEFDSLSDVFSSLIYRGKW